MSALRMLDAVADKLSRSIARRTSRRAFLSQLGAWLAGVAVSPLLLPVSRVQAAPSAPRGESGDPADCSYWRYCASNGFLCSCCGGSFNQCPPGTEMSKLAWIGTCRNPVDGKNYLISYNDCCGKASCGQCSCNRFESEMPVYRTGKANDILWCSANDTAALNCTVAIVLGPAEDA